MKRFLALCLVIVLCFTGCTMDSKGASEIVTTVQETIAETSDITETQESETEETTFSNSTTATEAQNLNYTSLNDPELLQYVKDTVYTDVVEGLNSEKYFVENVDTVYVSKEYLDELAYNSQENVYFGYTLSDITSEWGDTKYIFTVDDNGQTTVQAFEEYDDTYDKAIRNVAIGTGVILVCVTVSVVTGGVGTAPAISMIFAASAKTGTAMALSSGVIGGAATAITCGIEGKSLDDTLKETTLSASEGFMWGAIGGAVTGGADKAIALKGEKLRDLTVSEAAQVQQESELSPELIKKFDSMSDYKEFIADSEMLQTSTQELESICLNHGFDVKMLNQFHSAEELKVYTDANLVQKVVNGNAALVRNDIDITSVVDDMERTNLERMQEGLAALDKDGHAYELHHIGQRNDSPLAILTQGEHDNKALHWNTNTDNPSSQSGWNNQRKQFWEAIAKMIEDGEIQ